MKVLITGGAGFIGLALGKRLAEQGHQVDLVDNFARGARDEALANVAKLPNVSLIEVDLLATGATDSLKADYTRIYHFAARLGVDNVLKRPFETLQDNILLMVPILALARRQAGLERFVFASTSEVYAGSLQVLDMPIPTPEATPLVVAPLDNPRTSYMLSKIYGEALVQQSGLPFTIVRPHNIYGPRMGMSHVVPQLLEKAFKAKEGDAIEVFSPDHTRTFCFIDDAVELLIAATGGQAGLNQVLNLGNETPEVTIAKVADVVIATVGKKVTPTYGPVTQGSPTRRCPAMGQMLQATGLAGVISLEEGIKRTYDWYRPNVFEKNP